MSKRLQALEDLLRLLID